MESPLFMKVALGISLAGAGFWAFVQAIERVGNWSLNREFFKSK